MEILQTLLDTWQVRHNRKQKDAFLAFAKEYGEKLGYDCRVEESKGLPKCRNFVAGDPEKAKIVFTAHYDTCARMPFPNMVYPDRRGLSILIQMPWILLLVCVALGAGLLAWRLSGFRPLFPLVYCIVYFGLFLLVFLGPANPHTANDNTSGVAAVLAIMAALPKEQHGNAAFLLFDNEELGLVGSKAYNKAHKDAMAQKPLLNLDCIGDGNIMYLVLPKGADEETERTYRAAFPEGNGFSVEIRRAEKTRYNSDQRSFKNGAALAAFRPGRLGNVLGRIHTKHDTVCEEKNLQFAVDGALRLTDLMSKE